MEEKKPIQSPRNKYNCLMIRFDIPNWDKFVNNLIKKEDIFMTKEDGFGIEDNPHVTILFGIHDYVPLSDVKKSLVPIKHIKCKTRVIDVFPNPQFDVVKFNVEGNYLKQMNKALTNSVDYTTSHPEYKAHMTIAYAKPGTGNKYKKTLSNLLVITPVSYIYSHADGTKEEFFV